MTTQLSPRKKLKSSSTQGTPVEIPCCPELVDTECTDKLRFRYRLPFNPQINRQRIPVGVTLVFEYERCSCGTTPGDMQHTFSLLPGETVRLFTSDKSSRWSFDKETSLSYRHERTSSESHLSFGFARAVSDLDIAETSSADSSFDESWAEGGGGASVNLGIISIGGGGSGGSYSADSSRDFAHNLSRHAESSSSYVAASVRASRSVSMGEVETREHAEGESEQHFEASTRHVRNSNRCHAVNYFVWQLMKKQRIRWSLVAVETSVNDPAAPSGFAQRLRQENKVSTTPQALLPTDIARLPVTAPREQATVGFSALGNFGPTAAVSKINFANVTASVFDSDIRDDAISAVKADLQKTGMVNDDGSPTKEIIAELSWEHIELIPTGGLMVKGCLDPCSVCEPQRENEIELDLKNKSLQNELLTKQIALLDKHSDYRCCPVGETEPPEA
jgi:hypothetical protein